MAHAAYTSGCRADDGVERVLFARGAGGLLNPMEEGISAAMESGRAAAYAIAEHLEKLGRSLYGIPQRDRRAAKLWEAPMGLCRRKGGDLPGDAAVKGDEIHDGGGHEGPGAVFGRIEPVGLQGLSSIRGAFWLFRRICPRMCSSKAGRRINRGWRRRFAP